MRNKLSTKPRAEKPFSRMFGRIVPEKLQPPIRRYANMNYDGNLTALMRDITERGWASLKTPVAPIQERETITKTE